MIIQNEDIIVLNDVTKDYGYKRGIFGESFSVKKGEAFGLVGENGAGKTTTLRNIMGFIRPDHGKITVEGKDAFLDAFEIKKVVGYVPGEIALPQLKTGRDVLKSQMELLNIDDFSEADRLIKKLQLNIEAYPKRMSKGMKQKMAVVMALMSSPDILILDEPTTGLDPLMREAFMKVLLEEKGKGRTILISSNSYPELSLLCDKVALISQGHLMTVADNNAIQNRDEQDYKIEFLDHDNFARFRNEWFRITKVREDINQLTVEVRKKELTTLFQRLKLYQVKYLTQVPYTLETYLDDFIKKEGEKNETK